MAKEKVLIVDDEEGIREVLKEFFMNEGFEVTVADDGARALTIFSETDFDLVLTDIKMPGIDGIETLRRMKKEKSGIKVIVMSGLPDEETLTRATAVSEGTVEAFVPKPFKPANLRSALAAVKEGKLLPSFGLTERQIAALNAVGKAGVEEASTALGQLTHRSIELSASDVRIGSLGNSMESEVKYAGILLRLAGDVSGTIAVIFPWEDGLKLLDMLENRQPGETKDYQEKSYPLLQAAGNVLAASYLNAVAKTLGLKAKAEPLGVEFGTEASVLGRASEHNEGAGATAIIIGTAMEIPASGLLATVSLLPDTKSLKKIFQQAGAFEPV